MDVLIWLNAALFLVNIGMGIYSENLEATLGWFCALLWVGIAAGNM